MLALVSDEVSQQVASVDGVMLNQIPEHRPGKERGLGKVWLTASSTTQMLLYSLGCDARKEVDEEFVVLWGASKFSVV